MSFEGLPPTPPRPLYRWVPVCPDHEAIETCPACALAAARRESARLSAELADARGWLREHAKWACGHISEGTGGEPEVCRICAVQDSEAEARQERDALRQAWKSLNASIEIAGAAVEHDAVPAYNTIARILGRPAPDGETRDG